MVGDSSRASWLDVPNRTSCLLNLLIADAGLNSFSATNLGLVAVLAVAFLDLVLVSPFSDAGLDVERLRADFLAGLLESSPAASFSGTLVVFVVVVVRRAKKSLVTSGETASGC